MVKAETKEARDASAHVSRWADRLRVRLRPVDRVGVYGPSAVLIAVPESTPELVASLAAGLAGGVPKLACGVVTFPSDGSSADELLGAVQVATRKSPPVASSSDDDVVIKNAAMKEVMATAKRLAGSTVSVLIHGETGTGKEVLARAIHDGGPRKKHPLRTINCAAIPGMLIESVLFGHEQGSFTGADKASKGIFEQADGGTVFLDEVGALAAAAQAALLRVLETKRVTRVGGDREIAVDIRLILRPAPRPRRDGRGRAVPPGSPVPAQHRHAADPAAARACRRDPRARGAVPQGGAQAERRRRQVDRARGARRARGLRVARQRPRAQERHRARGRARGGQGDRRRGPDRAGARQFAQPPRRPSVPPPVEHSTPASNAGEDVAGDYREHVRRYEAKLIIQALHRANGNQTEAARQLGLPLRTLVHKIQQYGVKKKFDR